MSQIKTTATLLAMGLGAGLFLFQNCAEQPVSSRKATKSSECQSADDCYEEEEGQNGTTTTTARTTTTTMSNGGGGGGGGSGSKAEVTSVYLVQNGSQIPVGGYYSSQLATLQAVVTGRNITQVQWGSDAMTCTQSGGIATCTLSANLGATQAGFYGMLNVVAMNGTNTALSQTLSFGSQCYGILGECRFILLGSALNQAPSSSETTTRGRSLGAFIATGLSGNSLCNSNQSQDSARGLAASNSYNRASANACIFFRAYFGSGQAADYQCFYMGLNSPTQSPIYFNATHEVPCNSGLTLQQMGGVTSDMGAYSTSVGLVVRHRATNLSDIAVVYANCTGGVCQLSSTKSGHRTGSCTTSMCSF